MLEFRSECWNAASRGGHRVVEWARISGKRERSLVRAHARPRAAGRASASLTWSGTSLPTPTRSCTSTSMLQACIVVEATGQPGDGWRCSCVGRARRRQLPPCVAHIIGSAVLIVGGAWAIALVEHAQGIPCADRASLLQPTGSIQSRDGSGRN